MYLDDGVLAGAVLASVSTIVDESTGDHKVTVLGIEDIDTTPTTEYQNYKFIQTEELTREGLAVHPWGGIVVPYRSGDEPGPSPKGGTRDSSSTPTGDELIVVEFGGNQYAAALGSIMESAVGTPIVFEPLENDDNGGGGSEL